MADRQHRQSGYAPVKLRLLAVLTLASEALATSTVVSQDAVESVQAIIAEIDRKLSEQINLILHHEEFQKLEGAWRGLQYLVQWQTIRRGRVGIAASCGVRRGGVQSARRP